MTDFKAARPAGCRPRRRTPTTRLLPRDDEVHPDDERAQQAAHDYPEGAQFHSPDSQLDRPAANGSIKGLYLRDSSKKTVGANNPKGK
jgi:hypothetical protein